MAGNGEAHGPMHQFEVYPLIPIEIGGYDVSFTNASLWMVLTLATVTLFFTLGMRKKSLVPGRWQSMVELSYEFISDMLRDTTGKDGKKFFPFVFTTFMFVLACNLLGMMPYSFTVTSHIIVTFALALIIFLGVTALGFIKHGLHFFKFFVPEGLPLWMAPLMVVIEVISYLARPITLSVRLAANMMAGHTMLKVIAGFIVMLGWQFGWLPFAFLLLLTGLEIFVAALQAYIFTILVCVYLSDAIHLH